jgi:RHS repeat-associated protein
MDVTLYRDGMGRIVRQANEMSNDGHVLRAYVFMPDGYTPLLMIEYGEYEAVDGCYAYHNDHLSTPRAMTDDSGAVVWRASLAPFGQRIGACDTDQDGADDDACPVEQPLRFPGQWDDAGTGLYYNWHRYYVPGLGVYTRLDPLSVGSLLDGLPGRTGGRSGYSYGRGSPGLLGDPAGLWEMPSAESPFPSDPYEELFGPLGTAEDYRDYYRSQFGPPAPPQQGRAAPFWDFNQKHLLLEGMEPVEWHWDIEGEVACDSELERCMWSCEDSKGNFGNCGGWSPYATASDECAEACRQELKECVQRVNRNAKKAYLWE